ncbi:MAG TPA: hypothetical protein VG164_09620 [Trebonia sp.]|nr:hypothetical protein [Trebonia sp.]
MNGDVPGNGAAGGGATGDEGSGGDAAWLDLVARFDAPGPEAGDGAVPWPEREDIARAVPVTPAVPEALPADPPAAPAGRRSLPGGAGPRDTVAREDPADDHFVPPAPPPLPRLDPVTKAAWLFLFGGPCYLLLATAVGWTITGLAAFLAVAAFVGGFAVLVFRMDSGGPRDSGPDDGAVV